MTNRPVSTSLLAHGAAGALTVRLALGAASILSLGWIASMEAVMKPLPDRPAIAPRPTFIFVPARLTLLLRLHYRATRLVSLMALMIAGLAGMEAARLLWHDVERRSAPMAPATAIDLYIASFCLFTFDARQLGYRRATLALA